MTGRANLILCSRALGPTLCTLYLMLLSQHISNWELPTCSDVQQTLCACSRCAYLRARIFSVFNCCFVSAVGFDQSAGVELSAPALTGTSAWAFLRMGRAPAIRSGCVRRQDAKRAYAACGGART